MSRAEVAAAVRIGIATRAPGDVEWMDVFDALDTALPGMSACQLCGWDPVTSRFVVIAEYGYSRRISADLVENMPRTQWGRWLFDAGNPLLMDDMPQNFRASPHYEQWLAPAGLDDGMSATLRSECGRRVGMMHISAGRAGTFSEGSREFVAEIGKTLAPQVDPLRYPRLDAQLGKEWAASRILPGRAAVRLTKRDPCPITDDPRVVELAETFAILGATALAFLWRTCEGMLRVIMLAGEGQANRGGVLVASTPFDNELGLTAREIDVITGVVAGLSNQAIADRLVVSRRTVETYAERLLAKLGCSSRSEAAAMAGRAGLLTPTPGTGGVGDLDRLVRGVGPLRTPWA